jgi:hypothetical protein
MGTDVPSPTEQEESATKDRTPQVLLTAVAVLLTLHLFRSAPLAPTAQVEEAE